MKVGSMMDQKTTVTHCGRGEDLVSFLYGEANEREAADFQVHLQKCTACSAELADFGQMHESMVTWRDEMLAGFVASPVASPVASAVSTPVRQKSALAALREFFDLSPLWLKGAVGFAGLLLVAFALIGVSRMESKAPVVTANAKYTEKQLQDRLAQAQSDWKTANQIPNNPPSDLAAAPEKVVEKTPEVKPRVNVVKTTPNKARSPLSKSEREQLAADLRLRSSEDEELTLLGDRINQEF
jgi:hypothetical protein